MYFKCIFHNSVKTETKPQSQIERNRKPSNYFEDVIKTDVNVHNFSQTLHFFHDSTVL